MSIENLKNKELNQSQIDIVSGGDNGDYELEWSPDYGGVKYLYNIGEEVEVYQTGMHWHTTRRTILDRRPFAYKGGWVGEYKFEVGGNRDGVEWYLADEIER